MPSPLPAGLMRAMQTSPHIYVECDIPDGMTLTEWRRSQVTRTGRRVLSLA